MDRVDAEWGSETARWKTLTEGLGDVESAVRSLRGVLAELDRTMAERFNVTFARVAEEFAESFADLFGGGAARLVLAEGSTDGSGAGGVEIVAPGTARTSWPGSGESKYDCSSTTSCGKLSALVWSRRSA